MSDTMEVGKSYIAWIQQANKVIRGSHLLHPSGLRNGKGKALQAAGTACIWQRALHTAMQGTVKN